MAWKVCATSAFLRRVIFLSASPFIFSLVAGDGDYKEAIRFVRRESGKDVQIVSWRRALSNDLEKLANKPTIILDDHWESLCEVKGSPPLEQSPAVEEKDVSEQGE